MLEKNFNKETPRTWIYPPIKTTKNTDNDVWNSASKDISQQKPVIPEKQETNEVSPMMTPPYCMEKFFFFF